MESIMVFWMHVQGDFHVYGAFNMMVGWSGVREEGVVVGSGCGGRWRKWWSSLR